MDEEDKLQLLQIERSRKNKKYAEKKSKFSQCYTLLMQKLDSEPNYMPSNHDGTYYHLHSFLETRTTHKDGSVFVSFPICTFCSKFIKEIKVPTYSLKNGHDYGVRDKEFLKNLSLITKFLISPQRTFCQILKIVCASGVGAVYKPTAY